MPPIVAAALITAAGAGAAAGASVYASKKQSAANKAAQKLQKETFDTQLTVEQEQEQRRRQEFDAQQERERQAWEVEQARIEADRVEEQRRYELDQQLKSQAYARDAERLAFDREQYAQREAHAAPYRAAGNQALSALLGRAGLAGGGGEAVPALPSGSVASGAPLASAGTGTDASQTAESGSLVADPRLIPTRDPGVLTSRPDLTAAAAPQASAAPGSASPTQAESAPISPEAYQRLAGDPQALAAQIGVSPQILQAALARLKPRTMGDLARRSA